MSRQWSRSELAQQLRNEILGYLGAASDFDERVAKKLELSRTDMRCLDLIGRLGPMTAGRLAEQSGLTTGAVTFILDRLEEAGMVTRRRDTEDRRRVWVEMVPEARDRLQKLQQPVAEEMRQVAQRFKAEELAVVRDFMREAKEVFQRQIHGALHEAVHEAVHGARNAAESAAHEARRTARERARDAQETAGQARQRGGTGSAKPPAKSPAAPRGSHQSQSRASPEGK
jgi:DNA-binding MarR family transcriptional regulator